MSRLNQKEIAEKLGVSQTAVSGVINGIASVRVSKEVRRRILEAVKEANYQPNRLANALLKRDTKTVGVLYQGGFIQLGVSKLVSVVNKVVGQGCLPLVCELLPGMSGIEQCQLFCDLNVRGVLLVNISEAFMYDVFPRFLKGKMNIASIDSPWEPSVQQVFTDKAQGFRILTEHLIKKGYRKIAILAILAHPRTVDSPYTHTNGLLTGAGEVLAKAGLTPCGIEFFDSNRGGNYYWGDPYRQGQVTMGRLLDKGHRPDAVICSSDAWAIGAMKECEARGLSVPDDIAIVGFNDEVQADYARCPLTTIAPPIEQLVDAAVERIINPESNSDQNLDREFSPTMFPCALVVRESCGKQRFTSKHKNTKTGNN